MLGSENVAVYGCVGMLEVEVLKHEVRHVGRDLAPSKLHECRPGLPLVARKALDDAGIEVRPVGGALLDATALTSGAIEDVKRCLATTATY